MTIALSLVAAGLVALVVGGDVLVRGGRAEPFEAYINGSGDIAFRGTAVNVTVRESGGGDVEIRDIEGSIDWRRNGRSILRVGSTD